MHDFTSFICQSVDDKIWAATQRKNRRRASLLYNKIEEKTRVSAFFLGMQEWKFILRSFFYIKMYMPPTASAPEALPTEACEEWSFYQLKLVSFDAQNKLKVWSKVKNTYQLTAQAAKELLDRLPVQFQPELSYSDALSLQKEFQDCGAEVELVKV